MAGTLSRQAAGIVAPGGVASRQQRGACSQRAPSCACNPQRLARAASQLQVVASGSSRRSAAASAAAASSPSGSAAPLAAAAPAAAVVSTSEREVRPGVFEGFWQWQGHRIRYQRCGDAGPAVLCVHGFGASSDHWRKNLPVLGETCQAYAIDLLGYGYSDKPDPRGSTPNAIYNFENWGQQLRDFIAQVIGRPATLACNSVGGIAGLQASLDDEESLILGVMVMNISLRMLHTSKQSEWQRPLVSAVQTTLRTTSIGAWFFSQLANAKSVKTVLQQCYGDPAAVTDELVEAILTPGLQPGAVDVFLDFISYSSGPLPEDQLRAVGVPVSVVWGEEDPWEKVEWGREFAKFPSVQEFVTLPGVGHCPQDEAPHLVNPLILDFVRRVC